MKRAHVLCLLAAGVLVSCADPGEPESFRLERFLQADKEDVYLNEKLVFKFNAQIDPFSISRESLAVVAQDGSFASGSFSIESKEVEFRPDPVLRTSLDDGGLRPGMSYEVRVAGFPRVQGLRSADGRVLPGSLRFRFRVVDPTKLPSGARTPFWDESPGELFAIRQFSEKPKIGESLQLSFWKAIRPDCVNPAALRLFEGNQPGQGEEISVSLRLLPGQEQKLVEIKPDWSRIRPDAIYRLEIDASKVSDFSGNLLFREAFADRRPILYFRFLP